MSLLIYNMTHLPLVLANGVGTKIPVFKGTPWVASGNEMKGRTYAQYAALKAQQDQGLVVFRWTELPEYDTAPLVIGSTMTNVQYEQAQRLAAENTKPPVIIKTANFDLPEFPTGEARSVVLFEALPYSVRIVSVTGAVSRGAPNAQMYLCCEEHGNHAHEPYSDRFDASQPGMLVEMASVTDRIVEAGEHLFAFASTDYVLGYMTVTFQPLPE